MPTQTRGLVAIVFCPALTFVTLGLNYILGRPTPADGDESIFINDPVSIKNVKPVS
jgi:hypothetical protein